MSAVQLIELGLAFGSKQVLRDCSLSVKNGEYLVILGESGGGKTSLLRAIAGLSPISSGQILLFGDDVARVAPRNRGVTLVPQQDGLYPHLAVARSIEMGIRSAIPPAEKRRRITDAARMVGIEGLLERLPQQLSGGERRRAAVAKAVASGAPIRLLDEPLSAVDSGLRFQIEDDLMKLHRCNEGVTIHVTHNGGVAMRMADRVAVLEQGRIVQCDSPTRVSQSPVSVSVASALGTSAFLSHRVRRKGDHWETSSGIKVRPPTDQLGQEAIVGYYAADEAPISAAPAQIGGNADWLDPEKQVFVPAADLRWIAKP